MIRLVCTLLLALTCLPAQAAVQLKAWLEFVQKVDMRVVDNGVVEEVAVSTGQRVKQGDLLLRMDQREAKARLLEARASQARAKINTERAARALARARELYEQGHIAAEELKDAELEDAAAVAEEESAKAAVAAAQTALERTELRAPYNGVVVQRNVWEGEVVYKTLQQEPLLVIAPDGFMLARALVTAQVLRQVKPGQPGGVDILGEVREAQVYSLGVEPVRVDLQGAVYALDLIFERRPEELLRPSEKVQIVLP
jgi:RND family efflux transporter MFP subunit